MIRSMYSAISGLRNHQIAMDVIGNNIANINTTAFKSSKAAFQDIVSQAIRNAGGAQTGTAGLSQFQVGLGVALSGIDTIQNQGSLQATGRSTDLAIQGSGFFILSDGTSTYYTRDGAFALATDGSVASKNTGLKVQGWLANASGVIDSTKTPGSITIPIGQQVAGRVTSSATLKGNLDAGAAVGAQTVTTLDVYDSLGNSHAIEVTLEKTGNNTWTWLATPASSSDTVTPATATSFTFTSEGVYSSTNPAATITCAFTNGATSPATVTLDLSALTQFAADSEVNVSSQNGLPAASLVDFVVEGDGQIVGIYSNGSSQNLGQLALATFANPGGLWSVGSNQYQMSSNSGSPVIGAPSTGARGSLVGGALESSNVDLAQQFTDLIVAERGFQANARVITSADQMLQDLVNLKR